MILLINLFNNFGMVLLSKHSIKNVNFSVSSSYLKPHVLITLKNLAILFLENNSKYFITFFSETWHTKFLLIV